MSEAELHLMSARIHLLHMACYSSTLLSIVGVGLRQAMTDQAFFSEPFRRLRPDMDTAKLHELGGLQREITVDQAAKGAKAACLIFHHAGLEAALEKVARAAREVHSRWHDLLANKQLSVQDLLSVDHSVVLQQKIDDRLTQFERDTLLSKTTTLFRVYQPTATALDGYGFSQPRLERIDKLRHQCAHGGCDVADFSQFEDDIDYLTRTGEYFIRGAADALGITLFEPLSDITSSEQSAKATAGLGKQ